jgi:hypothetical protein
MPTPAAPADAPAVPDAPPTADPLLPAAAPAPEAPPLPPETPKPPENALPPQPAITSVAKKKPQGRIGTLLTESKIAFSLAHPRGRTRARIIAAIAISRA